MSRRARLLRKTSGGRQEKLWPGAEGAIVAPVWNRASLETRWLFFELNYSLGF